ncbi:MAG: DoxX family protein [Thermodesulfobacteriota bacterium]
MIRTSLKRFLQPVPQSIPASAALFLIRLIAGAAFVLHGWGKIQTPFGWNPPESPISIPVIFQFLAAISEFGGGIAWILGFLTPVGSLGIGCTMAVAVYFHSMIMKDPFVNMTGGSSFEPALVYLGVALVFLVLGPGKFSLDKKIFGERK